MTGVCEIVSLAYLLAPPAAVALVSARAWRVKDVRPVQELVTPVISGAAGGAVLVISCVRMLQRSMSAGQVMVTCYWGIAVALVLWGMNLLLARVLGRVASIGRNGRALHPRMETACRVTRALLLLVVGIPFVIAFLLIYRPRFVQEGTPASVLGVSYVDVTFTSTDGIRLNGWWIPAARTNETDVTNSRRHWGQRTVILCHGFAADKAMDLRLARDLIPNGYNVLAFDFRAHGQSGGSFSGFGDLERRDVLGAVRWARANHPDESRKIFGLGQSLGAAALIGAAADPSSEGQAIDAVAVFSPFDRLETLMRGIADANFMPFGGWIATRLALPIAGAEMGTPLWRFAPENEIEKLAPRPLLVLAAEQDRFIDIARSRALFEAASQPKYGTWFEKGTRRAMLFEDVNGSVAVRAFFEVAHPML